MSKKREWKAGRDVKRAEAWYPPVRRETLGPNAAEVLDFSMTLSPYPPHETAEEPILVGTGDAR